MKAANNRISPPVQREREKETISLYTFALVTFAPPIAYNVKALFCCCEKKNEAIYIAMRLIVIELVEPRQGRRDVIPTSSTC